MTSQENYPLEILRYFNVGRSENLDCTRECNNYNMRVFTNLEGRTLVALTGSVFCLKIFDFETGNQLDEIKNKENIEGVRNLCFVPTLGYLVFSTPTIYCVDVNNNYHLLEDCCHGMEASNVFSFTQVLTDHFVHVKDDLIAFICSGSSYGKDMCIYDLREKKSYLRYTFEAEIRSFKYHKGVLYVGMYGRIGGIVLETKNILFSSQLEMGFNSTEKYVYSIGFVSNKLKEDYIGLGNLYGNITLLELDGERIPKITNKTCATATKIKRGEVENRTASDYFFQHDGINCILSCGSYIYYSTKNSGYVHSYDIDNKIAGQIRNEKEAVVDKSHDAKSRIHVSRWALGKQYLVTLTNNFVCILRNKLYHHISSLAIMDLRERIEFIFGTDEYQESVFKEESRFKIKLKDSTIELLKLLLL